MKTLSKLFILSTLVIIATCVLSVQSISAAQNPNYPSPSQCNGADWNIGLPDGITCSSSVTTYGAMEEDPTATSIFGSGSRLKPDLASANQFCKQYTGQSTSYATYGRMHNYCNYCDQNLSWYTGSTWVTNVSCAGNLNVQNVRCATGCGPTCSTHSTKQCSGNSVYWYNSCGTKEDLFQACTSSQVCQNAQCVNITCSTNSQCGTNGYTGSPYCQNGDVYQNYKTYTCTNPGTANSACTNSDSAQLKTNCTSNQTCSNGSCIDQTITCSTNSQCGTNGYTGSPFCQNGDVYQNYKTYTCTNPGTANSACSDSTAPQLKDNCATNQTCSSGSCQNVTITCSTNSQCGTNAYTGSPYCQNGDVYQNYRTYTCTNPGTANSACSDSTAPQLKTNCTSGQTCSNGSCGQTCNSYSTQKCVGNSSYWYDSCGNQESIIKNCSSLGQVCSNGQCICTSCQTNCTSHASQKCQGNNLYWYDSCGSQQELLQYCQNGCSNGTCSQNNCTYHAYKLCLGNAIYWYDSCGSQQDLYQNCVGSNQTCQYGQCVIQPVIYTAHYRTGCQGNNLYWYDSLGALNSLYKNCADTNSCTSDICSLGKCSNTLKCDGTTCAVDSADYNSSCAPNHCGNGNCEADLGETTSNCSADCKVTAAALTLSFLGKKDSTAQQWNKTIEVGPDLTTYFLVNVINNSNAEVGNVNLSVNIPNEISSIGNLKVNDISVAGDIVSGIDIGSIGAGSSKVITFEGKTQNINTAGTKEAVATVSINGVTQSDSFTLNLIAGQAAAVSKTSSSSWLTEFLKRWYLWILVAIVLIFLFVVVFRRVSSN